MHISPKLTLDNIGIVRADRVILHNLTLHIRAGQIVVIRGPNGIGKSTLLRCLAGFLPPKVGHIHFKGENIFHNRAVYQSQVGYLGHLHGIKSTLTALENLSSLTPSPIETQLKALNRFKIAHLAHTPARFFSAGQKRRLALARLFLKKTSLWLLDEPTTALDAETTPLLGRTIEEYSHQGGIVIISTHTPLHIENTLSVDLASFAPFSFDTTRGKQ